MLLRSHKTCAFYIEYVHAHTYIHTGVYMTVASVIPFYPEEN